MANANVFKVEYGYDAQGRKIGRQETITSGRGVSSDGVAKASYIYDENNVVLDMGNGSDPIIRQNFFFGAGINNLAAIDDPAVLEVDTLWAFGDNLGTIRSFGLYNEIASSSSEEWDVLHQNFGEFGERGRVPLGDVDNVALLKASFLWAGHQTDLTTGLLDAKARWYDSSLGRFLSEDPLQFASGDSNFYRYVGNSPGNGIDPDGRLACGGLCIGGLAIYAFGAGALYYGAHEAEQGVINDDDARFMHGMTFVRGGINTAFSGLSIATAGAFTPAIAGLGTVPSVQASLGLAAADGFAFGGFAAGLQTYAHGRTIGRSVGDGIYGGLVSGSISILTAGAIHGVGGLASYVLQNAFRITSRVGRFAPTHARSIGQNVSGAAAVTLLGGTASYYGYHALRGDVDSAFAIFGIIGGAAGSAFGSSNARLRRTVRDFGHNAIGDNPRLRSFWEQAVVDLSQGLDSAGRRRSNNGVAVRNYLQAIRRGQSPTGAEARAAYESVAAVFRRRVTGAIADGEVFDGFAFEQFHHANWTIDAFATQAIDPTFIFPMTLAEHIAVHIQTTSATRVIPTRPSNTTGTIVTNPVHPAHILG